MTLPVCRHGRRATGELHWSQMWDCKSRSGRLGGGHSRDASQRAVALMADVLSAIGHRSGANARLRAGKID